MAGQAESWVGCQGCSGIVAMLGGGSLGSKLGYLAGVIKPVRVALVVLVEVVQVGGWGKSYRWQATRSKASMAATSD